ncbi:MAG: hypothetical protein NTY45_12090 [Elusimicrobia bacterium]|nr:hypothetical protein [Elusimicrobiota bacterium]
MKEQLSPDPGAAPKGTEKSFSPVLLAALLAAGLCLALIPQWHRSGRVPASPAAGGAARGTPAAQPPAAAPAPAMMPLGRSMEGITTRYKGMKPGWIEPITAGPLRGGTIRKYTTSYATDDLYTFNGAVYRRVMSFRLADMLETVEGTHANFSGLVFTYALYPSAFDEQHESGQVPPELKKLADAYGEKCGQLAEPGSRPAEHRELHGGYVFYCSNRITTRLIYGVCSEGLLAAEAAGVK